MLDILLTALLALWLAFAATGLYGAVHYLFQARRFARIAETFPRPEPAPAAAIILPLKGAPAFAERTLAAILAQDYPRFRLIVVAEEGDAPAAALVRTMSARGAGPVGPEISLVSAPPAHARGQKVENLLAALATLRPADRIVCFVDADAAWSRDALATLVRELCSWGEALLLSGNRWMVPAGPHGAATVAAAAGLAVAANAKSPAWDLAWGGTMAMRRELLDRLALPELWNRSISDDVPLSRALRRQGWVKSMPNLVIPSPCDVSIGGALNFARRQYAMLRLYAPRHWAFAFVVQAVFFAGIGATVAAILCPVPGYVRAMALCGVALGLIRGAVHALAAARGLPHRDFAKLRRALLLDAVLPVVPALLHAYGLLASIRVGRIEWAGIAYRISAGRVVGVERPAPQASRDAPQTMRK